MKTLNVFALVILATTATQAIRLIPQPVELKDSINDKTNRVVGGEDAEEGFAKYQISLQGEYGGHMCGGVVLDHRHLLTASHCVWGYIPSYLRVITGTNEWKKPGRTYHVEQYWTHCNYDIPSYANDIAIIRTNETIAFDDKTQPVALADLDPRNGTECILTGWGSTELWGDSPDKLQKIKLAYADRKYCKEQFEDDPNLDISHMCTTSPVGEGACHGDSGGPVVCEGRLTGLVNWGYPCATGKPDAYASIVFFRDWIRRVTSNCKNCHCKNSEY